VIEIGIRTLFHYGLGFTSFAAQWNRLHSNSHFHSTIDACRFQSEFFRMSIAPSEKFEKINHESRQVIDNNGTEHIEIAVFIPGQFQSQFQAVEHPFKTHQIWPTCRISGSLNCQVTETENW